MVAGKREHGVVAPFQERLVNEIRGLELPSSSGWRTREGCNLLNSGARMKYKNYSKTMKKGFFFIVFKGKSGMSEKERFGRGFKQCKWGFR